MKIEYLHRQGGYTHQGPSGTEYAFSPDESGLRVAEVTDPTDQARFLSITDLQGRALFVSLDEPEAAGVAEPEPEKPRKRARH